MTVTWGTERPSSAISPAQFTGGPGEAHNYHNAHKREDPAPRAQRRLFDPDTLPEIQAHHQTPEQFAKDPRTWWHGRYTAEKSRLGGGQGKEGFHAGTEGAARTRLKANAGRRAPKPGIEGHLFPLRITGPVEGPENMHPDVPVHHELGPGHYDYTRGTSVGGRSSGYLYENQVESPGSISVGTPKRKGFLSTHKEMVQAAQKRGEKVHPLIAWATSKGPEHTGEIYPEAHQYRYASSPRQTQMHDPSGTQDWESGTWKKAMEKQVTHRTTYTSEGGVPRQVFRFSRDSGPNGALSPRQWQ